MKQMTLEEILNLADWVESDITKVYVGKSHVCRCGCCGDYFYKGSEEFDKVISDLKDGVHLIHDFTDSDLGVNYINIDTDDTTDEGECVCLYND